MTIDKNFIVQHLKIRLYGDILLALDFDLKIGGLLLFQDEDGLFFINQFNPITGIISEKQHIDGDKAKKLFNTLRAKYRKEEEVF